MSHHPPVQYPTVCCAVCGGEWTADHKCQPQPRPLTYIPPMRWCGVDHNHGPHTYATEGGFYAQCPGSTGPAPKMNPRAEAALRKLCQQCGGCETCLLTEGKQ